jgi:hypothetical protein
MFRAIILLIFRSTRLYVTTCGIMHPWCCRPATLWVHYITSCNTHCSAHEDGQNNCPKHVELTGIINKPLLLHLVACLYNLYFIKFFWDLLSNLNLFRYRMSCISYCYLFLVHKIFTFYTNDVLLFKCPFPRPKG